MITPMTSPPRPWPELLRPGEAAAMVSLAPSTFRALLPILSAYYGLRTLDVCGVKVRRDNLLDVLERLRIDGKAIKVRKSEGIVEIGERTYRIGGTR